MFGRLLMSPPTARIGAIGITGASFPSATKSHSGLVFGRFHSVLASSTQPSRTQKLCLTHPAQGLYNANQQQIRHMGKSCLKTNKSAAKRFRVRGSGSVKRNQAGMSHNTGYKAKDRKSSLAQSKGITGKKIEKRMRRLIGA